MAFPWVPVAVGGGLLLVLAGTSWGGTPPPVVRPPPPPPPPRRGDPIGPRPPNTWTGLSQARVIATGRPPEGLIARTGPGANFPIGPGGGNERDPNRNMAPWLGSNIAVLQTGIQGPGAREWYRIYTPGGHELYVAGVFADGRTALQPVEGTPSYLAATPLPQGLVQGVPRAGLGWAPYAYPRVGQQPQPALSPRPLSSAARTALERWQYALNFRNSRGQGLPAQAIDALYLQFRQAIVADLSQPTGPAPLAEPISDWAARTSTNARQELGPAWFQEVTTIASGLSPAAGEALGRLADVVRKGASEEVRNDFRERFVSLAQVEGATNDQIQQILALLHIPATGPIVGRQPRGQITAARFAEVQRRRQAVAAAQPGMTAFRPRQRAY